MWITTNRTNFIYPIEQSDGRQKWVLSLVYSY